MTLFTSPQAALLEQDTRQRPPVDARVLVYVGLDLMGDGLMKLPFVRALRAAFPDGEIIWLAGKGASAYKTALAPLVQGLITEVIDNADVGSHWMEILGRPLKDQSFDLVIDTQSRMLTTLVLKRIKTRFFISGAADFSLSTIKPGKGYARPDAMCGRLLDLLHLAIAEPPDPLAPLPLAPEIADLAGRLLPQGYRYIAFAPGAGGKQKIWPLQNYVTVARSLTANGYVPVWFLGPEEATWVDDIAANVPGSLFPLQHSAARPLKYRADLTIAAASFCEVGLSNDCGGGHLLAAAGIPLISLFGPTDPRKFAPMAVDGLVIRAQDFGGEAMDKIPPQVVLQALSTLLA